MFENLMPEDEQKDLKMQAFASRFRDLNVGQEQTITQYFRAKELYNSIAAGFGMTQEEINQALSEALEDI